MPYIFAENKSTDLLDINCSKCNKKFAVTQGCFKCDSCLKFYHSSCKNIKGMHIARLAALKTWYCCNECNETCLDSQGSRSSIESTNEPNLDLNLKLDIMMQKITTQNSEVKSSIRNLENTIQELKQSQDFLSEEFDSAMKQINSLQNENKKLNKLVNELRDQQHLQQLAISKLEGVYDDINQSKLTNNVLITGFKEQSFDPKQIAKTIFMKLGAKIKDVDVLNVNFLKTNYPLNNQQKSQGAKPLIPNYVLLELATKSAKEELMSKMKEKKVLFSNDLGLDYEINRRIYIRDQLTSYKAKLLRDVRELKMKLNFKYVWVTQQKIHLRKDDHTKVYIINNNADIVVLRRKLEEAETQTTNSGTLNLGTR